MSKQDVSLFEQSRPMLLGLAYRILGSRADAEDAVQDTYLKWQNADHSEIDNPGGWLTACCTRRCIDLLRSAHKARVEYVGTWLPEPLQTSQESAEEKLELASSLTTAFLLVLERLTPKERAAYLLHEVFDMPYDEISQSLDMPEATCRKLVSRARSNVDQSKVRHVTPVGRQEELLAAFESAVHDGATTRLAGLLSDDIQLCVDSGGKVPSLLEVLRGKAKVLAFISESLRQFWGGYQRTSVELNGGLGILVREGDHVTASVSFGYDDNGVATDVFIMRNPEKLARLEAAAAGRILDA
jgi:RNA polymerase sigma factor (sigma-70 family)